MVQIHFDKGVQISILSSSSADLIAVSLVCPFDLKSPCRMGPPRVSSVRNLLEKVGDLRSIAILVQSNWHFLHLLICTKPGQIVTVYHPPLSKEFSVFNDFCMQN